jgi:DNA topoisomerase 2-associated protein PAT1
MVEHLGQFLFGHLLTLFSSTRTQAHLPAAATYYVRPPIEVEHNDIATWQFLANFGINTTNHQQQLLVTELREKILDSVVSVRKGWITDENLSQAKTRNVNILLHALGLDSSQIAL